MASDSSVVHGEVTRSEASMIDSFKLQGEWAADSVVIAVTRIDSGGSVWRREAAVYRPRVVASAERRHGRREQSADSSLLVKSANSSDVVTSREVVESSGLNWLKWLWVVMLAIGTGVACGYVWAVRRH